MKKKQEEELRIRQRTLLSDTGDKVNISVEKFVGRHIDGATNKISI